MSHMRAGVQRIMYFSGRNLLFYIHISITLSTIKIDCKRWQEKKNWERNSFRVGTLGNLVWFQFLFTESVLSFFEQKIDLSRERHHNEGPAQIDKSHLMLGELS